MPISSPYENLEKRAFWRSGVAEASSYPPEAIYKPKFAISRETRILTAGSCFAQHVGRVLNASGFCVIDTEPMPDSCPVELQRQYGYGLYSARYGNLYSVRQFLQLLQEAYDLFVPAEPVWERDGRYYDALRPSIEPQGYETAKHVQTARKAHLAAVRDAVEQAQVVIFTLGLTEAWEHIESGTIYPTAPGTIAHSMDNATFSFRNFRAREISEDFAAVRALIKARSPEVQFILTVSPVPLTATATPQHVLPATVYSKSVLRTVCGELYEDFDDVDYFPSYEIVASHPGKAAFFEKNLRSVSATGVEQVMRCFMDARDSVEPDQSPPKVKKPALDISDEVLGQDDIQCEEVLLEAFGK